MSIFVPPNWPVPGTIGSATPNTGAFTTLTAQNGYGAANNVLAQLFTSTADSTDVTNTTSAISMVGTGIGTVTVPSAYWAIGKTIQWRADGYFTTVASPLGTWTITLKIGATTIWSQASLSRSGSLTKAVFSLWGVITCRTTGAGGTVAASMNRMNLVTNTLTNTTSPVTVDISAARLIDILITPSSADAGEHCVTQNFSMIGN